MILEGKYNKAKVFTDDLESNAKKQIIDMLNEEFTTGSKIRIMPDVHMGAGSVIGTTMTIEDKVVPNLVGVDIGCGLIVVELEDRVIDFKKLDKVIRQYVPSGFKIRRNPHDNAIKTRIDQLRAKEKLNLERAYQSIGTLGGGNHFIEINEDENHKKYLVIHSGSRNIGLQTAKHYQNLAQKELMQEGIKTAGDLAYLQGRSFDDYLHDIEIIQEFAFINRETMAEVIVEEMNFKVKHTFQTIHNYIDTKRMILRKGAVSANKDEVFIVPFNMRDGSIILKGKGNPEWNYSAPHGAGRLMSRTAARKKIKLQDFQASMVNVHSTSVSTHTLDEAPMAYKNPKEIIKHIQDTAEIISVLKPIYNFKAK